MLSFSGRPPLKALCPWLATDLNTPLLNSKVVPTAKAGLWDIPRAAAISELEVL